MNIKIFTSLTIKPLLFTLALCAILFVNIVSAQASQRTQYTCYVLLEDQSKAVHQFVALDESKTELLARLPKSSIFAADGITSTEVLSVFECVIGNQRFGSKEARKLAEVTPM